MNICPPIRPSAATTQTISDQFHLMQFLYWTWLVQWSKLDAYNSLLTSIPSYCYWVAFVSNAINRLHGERVFSVRQIRCCIIPVRTTPTGDFDTIERTFERPWLAGSPGNSCLRVLCLSWNLVCYSDSWTSSIWRKQFESEQARTMLSSLVNCAFDSVSRWCFENSRDTILIPDDFFLILGNLTFARVGNLVDWSNCC